MISHCPLITDMKTLYFTGPTWMFMTPEQMYGEQAKVRSAHKHYQNADIYFLTKMRKVRFNPKKSFITSEGQIHIVLTLGDPTGELEEKVLGLTGLDREPQQGRVAALFFLSSPQSLRALSLGVGCHRTPACPYRKLFYFQSKKIPI